MCTASKPSAGHGYFDWSPKEGSGALDLPISCLVMIGLTSHGVTEGRIVRKMLSRIFFAPAKPAVLCLFPATMLARRPLLQSL